MINNEEIFGTFRPLTPAQIRANTKFVSFWSVPFLIVLVGVAIAVETEIVWVGAGFGLLAVSIFLLIGRMRHIQYTPMFGIKYNLLRGLIGGTIVYNGLGWRGLLSIYYRYIMDHWDLSLESYGYVILFVSLVSALTAKFSLYRIENVHKADAVGIIEITALTIFISSLMFLLLYT